VATENSYSFRERDLFDAMVLLQSCRLNRRESLVGRSGDRLDAFAARCANETTDSNSEDQDTPRASADKSTSDYMKSYIAIALIALIAVGAVSWGVFRREDSKVAELPVPTSVTAQLSEARLVSQRELRFGSMVLTGTMADSDPLRGYAMIREGDGSPQLVHAGAMIVPQVKLTAVYRDHVLVDVDGQQKALWLTTSSAAERPAGSEAYDHRDLDEMFAAEYSYEDGLHRGFKLFPGRDPKWLSKLSLLPGDLVIAINGVPLDQPDSGAARLAQLRNLDSADLTIVRFDEPQTMRVKIKGADLVDPESGEASGDDIVPNIEDTNRI
jgi:type II secretion system protein C